MLFTAIRRNPSYRTATLALLLTCLVAACGRSAADPAGPAAPTVSRLDATEVWHLDVPTPAYAGMPAADHTSIAYTWGHSRLVLASGDGRQFWAATMVGLRNVAPLLAPNRVFAATDDGVVAYDRTTGRQVWEQQELGDWASTPVLAGSVVAVTTWYGRLVGIDAATGRVLWETQVGPKSYGPPATDGSVVVAVAVEEVVAVDAATGVERWRVPLAPDEIGGPAVVDGAAVMVAGDRVIHALELADGAPRWTVPTRGAGSPEVPPVAGPDGSVVVTDRMGTVSVIDMRSGALRWRARGAGAAAVGGPAAVGDAVAQPVEAGTLLIARGPDRLLLDPPGRVSGVATGPNGYLIVATREARANRVTAYDLG